MHLLLYLRNLSPTLSPSSYYLPQNASTSHNQADLALHHNIWNLRCLALRDALLGLVVDFAQVYYLGFVAMRVYPAAAGTLATYC